MQFRLYKSGKKDKNYIYQFTAPNNRKINQNQNIYICSKIVNIRLLKNSKTTETRATKNETLG